MSLKYRTSAGTSASNFTDLVVKVGDTLPIGTEVDYDGQTAPAGWQEVSETKLGNVVVDSIKTKNLLHITSGGLFPNTSGTVVELVGYYNAIIDVRNMSSLYISGNFTLIGDGMVRIGKYSTYPKLGSTGTRTGATSNGIIDVSSTNYLLLAFAPTSSSTLEQIKASFMLEEGTSATTHTPYQNLDDKMEYYSTEEIMIGYWIDGKPIYRKATPYTISTGWDAFGSFSNVDRFIKISSVRTGSGNCYPFYASASNYGYFYIPTSKASIFIATAGETSSQGVLIAEYTKTTD